MSRPRAGGVKATPRRGGPAMRGRKGRLAKFLSIPVLAACGFVIAATVAGGGPLAGTLDSSPTPVPSTTVGPPGTPTPEPPGTPTPEPTPPPPTSAPPNLEGCSQGFWSKHPSAWSGYSPSQTVGSVFAGLPSGIASLKLSDALKLRGGGLKALTRQAVAALLGAANPDVDYPITEAQVVDMVNAAVASGSKANIESHTTTLDGFNMLGAPGFC